MTPPETPDPSNGTAARRLRSLPARLAFRFAFVYFIVYSLPFPINAIPGLDAVDGLWLRAWHVPVRRAGAALFGVDITVLTNGSGDTTFNYVQVLLIALIAAAAAGAWTALDRRGRTRDDRLHEWLRVWLRYVLAYAMILYGMSKVFMLQFPAPDPARLTQPYGDSSPMGLLWTFMGASAPYTFFAGLMEVIGGLLLVPRRTVTLGALIVAGVMTNVVMLNLCYDVPVKLYSSHLLLMAIVLIVPDAGRLTDVLVRRRAVPAAPARPLFGRPWLDRSLIVLKGALVLALMWQQTSEGLAEDPRFGDAPAPALVGVYRVESFTRAGKVRPLLVTDGSLWRTLAFNRFGGARLVTMDDSITRLRAEIDEAGGSVTFTPWQQQDQTPFTLAFRKPDAERLELEGAYRGEPIRVVLRRRPDESFLLTSRGFRWISEYPFNR